MRISSKKHKNHQNKKAHFFLVLLVGYCISFTACSPKIGTPITSSASPSSSINYALKTNWAAHPDKADNADRVPVVEFKNNQSNAQVDVFFLHPTTYTKKKINGAWNASLNFTDLNEKTDRTTILHQASIFNGVGRVFAPRYQQAHLDVFFTKEGKAKAEKALNFAYRDVKAAFEYYLQKENNGRPIVIAAHSQGTAHAARLMKEYFDGKKLQKQLVAAYLVGMPVMEGYFDQIEACQTAGQTNCFCSWRTVKKGFIPKKYAFENVIVTNPLTWTTDNTYAPKELNLGTVLQKFENDMRPGIADAQIQEGFVWTTKPKFPWSFLITFRNYHIADYNFFYANVRKNVMDRTKNYLFRNKKGNR